MLRYHSHTELSPLCPLPQMSRDITERNDAFVTILATLDNVFAPF